MEAGLAPLLFLGIMPLERPKTSREAPVPIICGDLLKPLSRQAPESRYQQALQTKNLEFSDQEP